MVSRQAPRTPTTFRAAVGPGAMQVLRSSTADASRSDAPTAHRLFRRHGLLFRRVQKAVFYLMPLFNFYTGILPWAGTGRIPDSTDSVCPR